MKTLTNYADESAFSSGSPISKSSSDSSSSDSGIGVFRFRRPYGVEEGAAVSETGVGSPDVTCIVIVDNRSAIPVI